METLLQITSHQTFGIGFLIAFAFHFMFLLILRIKDWESITFGGILLMEILLPRMIPLVMSPFMREFCEVCLILNSTFIFLTLMFHLMGAVE